MTDHVQMTRRGFTGAMGAMAAAAALAGVPSAAHAEDGVKAASSQADAAASPKVVTPGQGIVYDPELSKADLSTQYTNEELDRMIEDQTMVDEDYTFPSGKTIPALYINLRNKINRVGWGIGSGVEGNENAWDFLMWLFTEDDAEHYLEMPMYEPFTARDYAILSGRSQDECEHTLESMADRMLIIRRHRSGQTFYELMNAEFGYWEWAINHWNDKGYVETHETSNGTGNP